MSTALTLEAALRATEILLALVLLQRAAEHLLADARDRALFAAQAGLSLGLLAGLWTAAMLAGLLAVAVMLLRRYQGPYNGGSDRMGLLILLCLCLSHAAPTAPLRELAFGYLAIQLVLSYVISGWVKLINPDWRSGQALRDVFAFSAYPVSEGLRGWAARPALLLAMSWAVIGFELVFPLAMISQPALLTALGIAALFHLANAVLFGLNRFFWTWLAAYPSLIWFQDRLFGGA